MLVKLHHAQFSFEATRGVCTVSVTYRKPIPCRTGIDVNGFRLKR